MKRYKENISDEEFLGKEFLQNCGDILKVLEKTSQKTKSGICLFRCQFQKYPYEVFVPKANILSGSILNPFIEENEFLNKEYKQKCGDILIPKKRIKNEKGITYYLCNFIGEYSCEIFAKKYHILRGGVGNPKNPNYYTSLEFWLKQYIKKLGFESENLWLGNKEIDIYIPKLKVGFEINGIYWHSNEFKNKYYHLNKLKEANKNGIKLYFIWEDEIWDSEKEVKSFIKDIILTGKSELYPKEVDKVGTWNSSFSEPQLIKRGCFECWNCGFILK